MGNQEGVESESYKRSQIYSHLDWYGSRESQRACLSSAKAPTRVVGYEGIYREIDKCRVEEKSSKMRSEAWRTQKVEMGGSLLQLYNSWKPFILTLVILVFVLLMVDENRKVDPK